MKHLVIASATVLALTAGAVAFAGYDAPEPVSIYKTYARGSFVGARTSVDPNQHIGCWLSADSSGNTSAECFARDETGKQASCTIFDNDAINKTIATLSPASLLVFSWNNAGECINVSVRNSSSGMNY